MGGGKSGKNTKAARRARESVVRQRSIPWLTIAGVGVVLVVALAVFVPLALKVSDRNQAAEQQEQADAAAARFRPSPQNPDPSRQIPGVITADYPGQQHVRPDQRVAYDRTPPFGGPHDGIWADCTGVVYPQPVRTENMVHSLEHGAVWIAYDPAKVGPDGVERLRSKVQNRPYTMMSPYPGMDRPISVQSWGHQLKVDSPDDPRIDQFTTALRQNPNGVYPEVGGACQAYPGAFDTQNPPPFDPSPAPPDAVQMDGRGANAGPMGSGQ